MQDKDYISQLAQGVISPFAEISNHLESEMKENILTCNPEDIELIRNRFACLQWLKQTITNLAESE